MENVRFNISPCTEGEVDEFIERIDRNKYVPNGEVRSTDKSHYDRYSFLAEGNRVALVYDTTAKILSVTGRLDFAETLLDVFGTEGKTVKRSTVPSSGTMPNKSVNTRSRVQESEKPIESKTENGMRAKLFVSPDRIKRRGDYTPVPTLFVSSKGAIISTDEIFPPQVVKKREGIDSGTPAEERPQAAKKRPLPSYGEGAYMENSTAIGDLGARSIFGGTAEKKEERVIFNTPRQVRPDIRTELASDTKQAGIAISAGNSRAPGNKIRRPVISIGSEEDGRPLGTDIKINTRNVVDREPAAPEKKKRGRPKKTTESAVTNAQPPAASHPAQQAAEKRKRGRPPKAAQQADNAALLENNSDETFKKFPPEALDGAVKRLKQSGKTVIDGSAEFEGTPQELKSYTVSDGSGQKVFVRYATNRMTLVLQGKRQGLFNEVKAMFAADEKPAPNNEAKSNVTADKKLSAVQKKLQRRMPTAFKYLSEQSRTDFMCGFRDISQNLSLSDYSGLLVPAFRGLERFVFDLQTAKGINVKMIGQAFDKDDSGKYILKSGYTKRIDSVVYAEVLVALYTEYFTHRNFFAHSDNTDSNVSRSLPEQKKALEIFNHLLDVVEYNAKKLSETGFDIKAKSGTTA